MAAPTLPTAPATLPNATSATSSALAGGLRGTPTLRGGVDASCVSVSSVSASSQRCVFTHAEMAVKLERAHPEHSFGFECEQDAELEEPEARAKMADANLIVVRNLVRI